MLSHRGGQGQQTEENPRVVSDSPISPEQLRQQFINVFHGEYSIHSSITDRHGPPHAERRGGEHWIRLDYLNCESAKEDRKAEYRFTFVRENGTGRTTETKKGDLEQFKKDLTKEWQDELDARLLALAGG